MTQPQPNLRESKRQQAAVQKKPATVTAIVEKQEAKQAARAAHPATASKKQPAKTAPVKTAAEKPARELSKVGPLPKPNNLDWTEKDGTWSAVSGRWRYRVTEGSGGWFAEQATGSWTPLHGDPQTVEQAKRIAEIVDAGAHWVGWAKYRALSWAEIEKAATEAGE
ncbi:hypothetical protein [Mycobacterium sp. UM_CSW]|uniref:hypothetical protein n=1 Tax=Mycobacterium sp. UM_CSW TaxID=1370119 RepID=UPI000426A6BB|nr:hypothetical protein [Mycobacterium sp. UM_CSW]